mmetsp:Transcript_33079/g.42770  ORF Transcript_33079/g.42770 Transcript_33079/m.42770 type:complete len:142 (-) Transcript_33079:99-524(-)
MAAEIAREIIAQSKGGSKFAFSFFYDGTDCNLLIFSSTCASNERAVYYVHTANGDRMYEIRCNDVSSAATLVEGLLEKKIRSLMNSRLSFFDWSKTYMKLVFYEGGVVGAEFLRYHFPISDQRDFICQNLAFLNNIDVIEK